MGDSQFLAGVKHRLHRFEVWRAKDFWTYGLNSDKKEHIKQFNTRALKTNLFGCTLKDLTKAEQDKTLPPDFLIDVKNWFWSVKEDGYFVKLIRNEKTEKWSIYTRKDIELLPPPDFLAGLEKNEKLPSVMHGELLTCFTGCSSALMKIEKTLKSEQFCEINNSRS